VVTRIVVRVLRTLLDRLDPPRRRATAVRYPLTFAGPVDEVLAALVLAGRRAARARMGR